MTLKHFDSKQKPLDQKVSWRNKELNSKSENTRFWMGNRNTLVGTGIE